MECRKGVTLCPFYLEWDILCLSAHIEIIKNHTKEYIYVNKCSTLGSTQNKFHVGLLQL
jgi:hypothetical protein